MQNKKIFIMFLVSLLLITACGKKKMSEQERAAERGERIMEMLLDEEGASDEERAQLRCMMNLTKTLKPLKSKLKDEHKLALRESFKSMEDSASECEKTLALVKKIKNELNAEQLPEKAEEVVE